MDNSSDFWLIDSTTPPSIDFEIEEVTQDECLNRVVTHLEKAWQWLVMAGANPHGPVA